MGTTKVNIPGDHTSCWRNTEEERKDEGVSQDQEGTRVHLPVLGASSGRGDSTDEDLPVKAAQFMQRNVRLGMADTKA